MIEKYFEKYDDMIISFNNVAKTKTIHFWFNHKWVIPEGLVPANIDIAHKTSDINQDNPKQYYCIIYQSNKVNMAADGSDQPEEVYATYDEMFDTLSAIFEFNIEAERKQALLKEKIDELQRQFNALSLDELTKMKFG